MVNSIEIKIREHGYSLALDHEATVCLSKSAIPECDADTCWILEDKVSEERFLELETGVPPTDQELDLFSDCYVNRFFEEEPPEEGVKVFDFEYEGEQYTMVIHSHGGGVFYDEDVQLVFEQEDEAWAFVKENYILRNY
jgi:hypothetical protein